MQLFAHNAHKTRIQEADVKYTVVGDQPHGQVVSSTGVLNFLANKYF